MSFFIIKICMCKFASVNSNTSLHIILHTSRTGLLQEGDRILAISDVTLKGLTLRHASDLLTPRDASSVCVTVEFDVADSVVPSSGVFNVKLFKRGAGLGITISCKYMYVFFFYKC